MRGTGFAAASVEIRWGDQSGELLTTAAGPSFTAEATVPDAAPNSYPVVAVVRSGGAVSTSNASFQVTRAARTTERAAPNALNRGGGIDGGLPDTTNGADPDPPTVNTAPATTAPAPATTQATTAPAVTAATAVTTTVVAAPDAAVAALPLGPAATTSTVAGGADATAAAGKERGAPALTPASTSQSSGAVRSPALLVAGLGLVVAGALALAGRSRRARGGQYS